VTDILDIHTLSVLISIHLIDTTCRLKSESEALRSELDSHHSTSMARERDIEKAREELQEARREAADRVRALEEEAQVAKQAAEQYGQQMEILKGDALKFQATARAAHGSYERELQLHAKAERDLKDMETGTHAYPPRHFLQSHTAVHCAATVLIHLFL
jgi:3-deoxy-D-arabino-heptulosonate 7-phosphate (DAHP) synthase